MKRRVGAKENLAANAILHRLKGGGRNSLGGSDALAASITTARDFRRLIRGVWHEDPVVRMRAADVAEKISRSKPALLLPFKAELLGLLGEERQQEVRWHLAAIVPRLPLTGIERRNSAAAFREYLNDRSSIVRTFALQALFELSQQEPSLRDSTIEFLHAALQSGTPAMKARARKLLKQMERE